MKLTTAQKREICVLFFSGEKTKSDLAKKFNVSHTAISKIKILVSNVFFLSRVY